jgi:hypothetical protein
MFWETNNYVQRILDLEKQGVSGPAAEKILPYILIPIADIKTAMYFDEHAYRQLPEWKKISHYHLKLNPVRRIPFRSRFAAIV